VSQPPISHANADGNPHNDLRSRKRADNAASVPASQPSDAATTFKPIGSFVADVLAKARPQ